MSHDVTYQGVVIKKVAYRDTDLVLGIFTKEDGKISVFVPGGRKSTKRFGPYLDLFAEIQLVAVGSPQKSLLRLKETQLISPHINVRKSLSTLGFATYYAECLWNLLADHDPHEDIYQHFIMVMDRLFENAQDFQKLYEYEYKLLEMCGYRPEFEYCGECKNQVIDHAFFSFLKGNVVCKSCQHPDQGVYISDKTLKQMLGRQSWDAMSYAEIRDVMASFVSYTIGKSLKSHAFRKGAGRSVQHKRAYAKV